MTSHLRRLATALWALAVLLMVGVVAGVLTQAKEAQPELPVLYAAPAFSLTDQEGRKVTQQSLIGKTWIAGFIFSRCAGPCPMMTAQMAAMQEKIASPDVHFVLFSVDPKHDTPEVLKAYAQKYNADASRWHMLTGTQEQLYSTANGMKVTAIPANEQNPIIHSERFLLVDRDGNVRAAYDSRDNSDLAKLAKDAATLTQ